MRWRRPDEVVPHFPEGACACGLDLAGAADLGVFRSYQREDVPEPQPSRRYQHDLHRTRCTCGRVHAAPRPAGVPDAPLSTGPRLSALAVYLTVFQHVPVERAQLLIADLAGGALSAAFVHSCLRKAAGLAAVPVRLIRALIAASPVAGKTQQKVSGRLTSDDVTQDRLDIRSYIDTARKHGPGALRALEQLMLGIAWTPPAQPATP